MMKKLLLGFGTITITIAVPASILTFYNAPKSSPSQIANESTTNKNDVNDSSTDSKNDDDSHNSATDSKNDDDSHNSHSWWNSNNWNDSGNWDDWNDWSNGWSSNHWNNWY